MASATTKKTIRDRTIDEICDSEAKYVKGLRALNEMVTAFIEEEKFKEKRAPSVSLVSDIKSQVQQLLSVNERLADDLKKDRENVGKIFLTYGPYFKLYAVYLEKCEIYMSAFRLYKADPSYKARMASHLISPVQRVPRYQLLLKDLIKRTPADHHELKTLEKALQMIKSTAGHMNANMKMMDQRVKYQHEFFERFSKKAVKDEDGGVAINKLFEKLDPNRRLVKHGSLVKISSKDEPQPVDAFLLEDFMTYAHEKYTSLAKAVPLSNIKIDTKIHTSHLKSLPDEYASMRHFAFLLVNPPPFRSIMMLASSERERKSWVETIQKQAATCKSEANMTTVQKNMFKWNEVMKQFKSTADDDDAGHPKWALAVSLFQSCELSNASEVYEYVKQEIRSRFGKDAINSKNKSKLKALGIAAPFCPTSKERTHEKWAFAKRMFKQKPFSNGKDKRYEEIKAMIRKTYGKSAINSKNKDRLKSIAVACKNGLSEIDAIDHPKWTFAQLSFSQQPFSNGRDERYEEVKAEIRFRWGAKAITEKDKVRFKALAIAAPYFNDMDTSESLTRRMSVMVSPEADKFEKNLFEAQMWVPNTSACMRCEAKFGFYRIPHHCRCCGYCVCHSCSKGKAVVTASQGKERVCDYCAYELAQEGIVIYGKVMEELVQSASKMSITSQQSHRVAAMGKKIFSRSLSRVKSVGSGGDIIMDMMHPPS